MHHRPTVVGMATSIDYHLAREPWTEGVVVGPADHICGQRDHVSAQPGRLQPGHRTLRRLTHTSLDAPMGAPKRSHRVESLAFEA
ncbi:hypothetical protein BN381_50180 [Candidatus Microthrix parvicella RN1]|uniref:Uncharacterized protein n=1 Tax=Candidatus Neomicrothrix parvicella RN1 TaxID=1229780 RepID=R4Z2T1_9ACTN|nr:hypothetical protein BN381_50180 [Candidatus Microthrix parvicella RN1]